jgi:hypothetical protein
MNLITFSLYKENLTTCSCVTSRHCVHVNSMLDKVFKLPFLLSLSTVPIDKKCILNGQCPESLDIFTRMFIFQNYMLRQSHFTRGWHRHRQVGRMLNNDLIPNIQLKGWNIVFFRKTKRKDRALYLNRFRSLSNPISRDRIFYFEWKKNRDLYLDFSYFVHNF